MNDVGQIVLIKNIIFKDLINNKIILSHDSHYIRPCLIISELDKRYLLPITSSKKNEYFKDSNMKITNYDLEYSSLTSDICYIKLDHIIEREPFYTNPVDRLDEIKYYKCLLKLIKYYESLEIKTKEYEMIEKDVKKQVLMIKKEAKLLI